MTPRIACRLVAALTLATAAVACDDNRRIACTRDALRACFGIEVTVKKVAGDSTRVTVRVQNLQGTIADDKTAWSQLLYIRVYRNMDPSLGFPEGGVVIPTWDPTVTTIGPAPAGSGWSNGGANVPSFVSEWVAVGGSYGTNVGYVAGKNKTYNEVVNAGAGLRTFSAPGTAPGWVTFTFVAGRPFKLSDIAVELSAWISDHPAASLPIPQQVGCLVIGGGLATDCVFLPYNL